MDSFDLQYIAAAIGRLSSAPIRIYERGQKTFFFSAAPLSWDPVSRYEDHILSLQDWVGYVVTEDFDFYGMVRVGEPIMVIGPTRQIPRTEQELRRLAFELEVPSSEVKQFMDSMSMILPLPLDFLLEVLCLVHYMICGEKLRLRDLKLVDLEQEQLLRQIAEEHTQEIMEPFPASNDVDIYSSYRAEQTILEIVRSGDMQRLEHWAASAPAIRPGQTSGNTLRQEKNIFTVTATLVSRAAIQGGMDIDDALRLSDSYIRKCDCLASLEAISSLQFSMVRNYTNQVARIKSLGICSELAGKVASYVRQHLSEPIRTEDLAQALFLSRSRLSTKFKEEQGMALADFIQLVKTNEAKYLLRHSDRSLLTISNYLGYSSQSHFSRAFKAVTGITPGEYRRRKE